MVSKRSCVNGGGAAAHWAERTTRTITFDYRRWLGYLREMDSQSLSLEPLERITPDRVRAYVEHLLSTISAAGTH